MTEPRDPPRWADAPSGVPPQLQRLFADAERDVPSEAALASLQQRLELQLAPPGTPPGVPTEVAPSPTPPLPVGRVLGGLVAAGLIGLAVSRLATNEPAPAPAPVPTRAAPAPRAPVQAPPEQATPERRESATPEVQSPAVATEPAAPSAPAARKRAPVDGALAEAQILERARRNLASNPARALALTAEHKQKFPSGTLRQEREVIAIEALRRLGRERDADSRAGEFEQKYPGSPHRRAVEKGLGK